MRNKFAVSWVQAFAAMVLLGLAAGLCAAEGEEPLAKPKWASSLDAALAAAQKSGKPVMIDFYTEWCSFCTKMDTEVLVNPKVLEALKGFELAKVDAEKQEPVANKYGVDSYPTYVFVDAKGKAFFRAEGFLPADPFAARLKRAVDLFKAQPELAKLEQKLAAGTATGEELARLAYLLRRSGNAGRARTVLDQTLTKLAVTSPARKGAELDKLLLDLSPDKAASVMALSNWITGNPEDPRRWEARYELGLAQGNGGDLVASGATLGQVSAGDPASEWGLMAKYYGAIVSEMCSRPAGGG